MSHQSNVEDIKERFMQFLCVLNGCLVVFEKKELVCDVDKQKWYESDGNESRNDSAENHRNEKCGHQVRISLSDRKNLAAMHFDILIFGFSRGFHTATSSIPARFKAADSTGEQKLNKSECDIEGHCENDDASNVFVPIRCKIGISSEENEADLL